MKKKVFLVTAASAALLTALAAVPAGASAAETSEKVPAYTWSTDEDGRIYCTDYNGDYMTGEQTIGGQDYLFSSTGVLRTGWRTVGGRRLYFSPETGKAVYGWLEYNGDKYYIDSEDGKVKGIYITDDAGYFFDLSYGALRKNEGTVSYEGKTYYVNADGSLATGAVEINGVPFVFSSEDYTIATGWQEVDGKYFYYRPEDSAFVTGLITLDGKDYYIDAQKGRVTGAFEYEGNDYFADENGELVSGWALVGDKYYYFSEDHTRQYGFMKLGDDWYYSDEENGRYTGEFQVGSNYYIADADGIIQTGWQTVNGTRRYYSPDTLAYAMGPTEIDGKTYLFSNTGDLLIGRKKYGDLKYYTDENGVIQTGIIALSDGTYYFSPDEGGALVTGWQTVDGKVYNFGTDGKMIVSAFDEYQGSRCYIGSSGYVEAFFIEKDGAVYGYGADVTAEGNILTGFCEFGGNRYYFNAQGKMLTGRVKIDSYKYYIDDNGVIQTGFATLADGTYYFDAEGHMVFGLQTIGGKVYYFDPDKGFMAVNKSIEGYRFGSDGVGKPLSDVQKKADAILAQYGSTPNEIYNYVVTHNSYKYIEDTRSLAQINTVGWSYFANYSIQNRYVVCYYFAAITDLLFQEANLESRIVYGTGRGSSEHYWNEVKINGEWIAYDTCNGYAATTSAALGIPYNTIPGGLRDTGLGYTITQYVYPVY